MKQFASIRFPAALAARECEAATRRLRSAGASATSWKATETRTYALVTCEGASALAALRDALPPGAAADVPPLAVLRVIPERAGDLPRLARALGGSGRFAGVVASATEANAVVIEVDVRTTSLHAIVSLIDAEVGPRGRRIEPVLPLGDEEIVRLAGALLRDPGLVDATRMIEPHLDLLARGAHP